MIYIFRHVVQIYEDNVFCVVQNAVVMHKLQILINKVSISNMLIHNL